MKESVGILVWDLLREWGGCVVWAWLLVHDATKKSTDNSVVDLPAESKNMKNYCWVSVDKLYIEFVNNFIYVKSVMTAMFNQDEIIQSLQSCTTSDQLESVYQALLGKQWTLSAAFKQLWWLSAEEKKVRWQELSSIKATVTDSYKSLLRWFHITEINAELAKDSVDITVPMWWLPSWTMSLLARERRNVEDLYRSMWFIVHAGHEIVTKYENFESVNIPLTHPATEFQDTYYFDQTDIRGEPVAFRSQTSSHQVECLKKYGAPIKLGLPGKVYRNENTDASHDTAFWQVEWLVVDEWISIAHFKDFATKFLSGLLQAKVKTRLRPWYFPYVEPWFEIDASCPICCGDGCSLCKWTWWIEIMGAWMIHPHVLKEWGVDEDIYSWFAFGLWLTRLVAIKYGIKDIRLLTNGDIRFAQSF